MKIAYFAEWDFSVGSGVQQKIVEQIQTWNSLGTQTQLFDITPYAPSLSTTSALRFPAHFDSASLPHSVRGGARSFLNKMLCARKAQRKLSEFRPDLIFYRLGIWHPGLMDVLSVAPTVIEVNSLDRYEMKNESFIKRSIYLWGRKKILSEALAFCPVSREIEADLSVFQKPSLVCSNGSNFGAAPLERKIISQRPQALFVGTEGQSWHGTDLILKLAQSLPEIDFHLVGVTPEQADKNVIFHGLLFGKQLDELARQMDIGLGSLALYRNGLTEASPLKTRQYGAWGLPYVYAFVDTDVPPNLDFVLQLPNQDGAVLRSASEIDDFARKHQHQPHRPEKFRPYFDRLEKEKKRLSFLKGVLQK